MSSKNLTYSLIEKQESEIEDGVTYEDLVEKVNEESQKKEDNMERNMFSGGLFQIDDIYSCELDYNENYTKKQLDRIADYYQIPKRKKKKAELVEEIVIFENDLSNYEITERRKLLWHYMEEIKNDNYLSKFIILD